MARINTRWAVALLVAAVGTIGVTTATGMQLQTPTDWKWRTDAPATVRDTDKDLAPNQWFYVGMPPGWHVTTGPGVVLYHPAHTPTLNYRVQSQAFLFPGDSTDEYGVFIGGKGLDGASPSYTAFVARRDGQTAVITRSGPTSTVVMPWTTSGAALVGVKDGTAKNIFTVEVGPKDVVFSVNGKEAAKVARAAVQAEGQVGLRAGARMNLHVSTFDLTHMLAPIPVK
jgi:hypothetical protein